jgi:hypothetical protein
VQQYGDGLALGCLVARRSLVGAALQQSNSGQTDLLDALLGEELDAKQDSARQSDRPANESKERALGVRYVSPAVGLSDCSARRADAKERRRARPPRRLMEQRRTARVRRAFEQGFTHAAA